MILDIGSFQTKFGLVDLQSGPKVFQSVFGVEQYSSLAGQGKQGLVISPDEEEKCLMRVEPLAERGVVRSPEVFEQVLKHCYSKSDIFTFDQNPLLISKWIFCSEKTLIEMMELCFEHNKQPALMFVNSSILSFLATGLQTGVSLVVGDQVTQISSFFKGFYLQDLQEEVDFGGRDVALCLRDYCRQNGLFGNELRNIRFFNDLTNLHF